MGSSKGKGKVFLISAPLTGRLIALVSIDRTIDHSHLVNKKERGSQRFIEHLLLCLKYNAIFMNFLYKQTILLK